MSQEYLLQKNKRTSIVDLGRVRHFEDYKIFMCVCVCVHTHTSTENRCLSTRSVIKRSTNSSFWGLLQAAVAAAIMRLECN